MNHDNYFIILNVSNAGLPEIIILFVKLICYVQSEKELKHYVATCFD